MLIWDVSHGKVNTWGDSIGHCEKSLLLRRYSLFIGHQGLQISLGWLVCGGGWKVKFTTERYGDVTNWQKEERQNETNKPMSRTTGCKSQWNFVFTNSGNADWDNINIIGFAFGLFIFSITTSYTLGDCTFWRF